MAMPMWNPPFLLPFLISTFLHRFIVPAAAQNPMAQAYTAAHNKFRQEVNMPPLHWDEGLAADARAWLALRVNDCLVHKHSDSENGFWELSDEMNAEGVVKAWYDEKRWYDRAKLTCNCPADNPKCMCGHYTQVVWGNTRRLGCANITCANQKGILVFCTYEPAGDYRGANPFAVDGRPQPTTPTPSLPQPTTLPQTAARATTTPAQTHPRPITTQQSTIPSIPKPTTIPQPRHDKRNRRSIPRSTDMTWRNRGGAKPVHQPQNHWAARPVHQRPPYYRQNKAMDMLVGVDMDVFRGFLHTNTLIQI